MRLKTIKGNKIRDESKNADDGWLALTKLTYFTEKLATTWATRN